MLKKAKVALILLVIYLIVFWIGFKSGAMYLRMQKKIQVERIEIPALPPPPSPSLFYLVEKHNYGSYSNVSIDEVTEKDLAIRMFKNEKLRPLLKSRDIEIYNESGERVY